MTEQQEELQLSGGGMITPDYKELKPNGQQKGYVVLSPEERLKGFVRPVRTTYRHVGAKPKYPTRPLTADEKERHAGLNYFCYEEYPESESPKVGRYWTEAQLKQGCNTTTTMALDIAETYARNPDFYGSTFCVYCRLHLPLEQFVWDGTDEIVGS